MKKIVYNPQTSSGHIKIYKKTPKHIHRQSLKYVSLKLSFTVCLDVLSLDGFPSEMLFVWR